jgi:hypothetical protein
MCSDAGNIGNESLAGKKPHITCLCTQIQIVDRYNKDCMSLLYKLVYSAMKNKMALPLSDSRLLLCDIPVIGLC